MKEIILVILTAVVLVLASTATANGATDLTASVEIPKSCGIIINPETIDFEQVNTGGTSSEKTTDVTNQGSYMASVDIQGLDWSGTAGSFGVDKTLFGIASSPTTPLASTTQSFANIGNGNTQKAYFKMSVPWGQSMGTYSQTITFTATC